VLAEIRQLLELQRLDERLADAEARRVRLHRERSRFLSQIDEARAAVDVSRQELAQLQHDSRMRNLEVDELDAQIRAYQTRLDEGIISFKEMEDLRAKIASERGRISQLEDEALAMMEAIEAKTREQDDAERQLAEREALLRDQIGGVEAETEEVGSQWETLTAERESTSSAIPSYLLTQYETLHAKFADPVAVIRNGTCGGCKLRLSGNTTVRVRGEMGVVTCEHCSRILYTI